MDIKELLKTVVAKGASDLHLCVGLPPMMRVNGLLHRMEEKPLAHDEILEMLNKILPEEKKVLLLGSEEIDLAFELKNVARFRTNIYYDKNGTCVAFRLIPNVIKSIKELGLPDVVNEVCEMRRGLVLVTGVTGSGKSTTLAAIIDKINSTRHDHIITIEDPIEFVYGHKNCIVNQREVGTHTHTFHGGLRAALREDPEVILVGEMRDLETISMAITAAETGHLVLATLHTRGAAQTVDRIIDIFPPFQQEQIRVQLAETLVMVISQVLLPAKDGKGRHLACEILTATTAVRQLIRTRKTHQIATEIETGGQLGMQTLDKSLKALIESGAVTKEVAMPWVEERKLFECS